MTTITPEERAQWRKESRAEYAHFSQDGMRLMRALDALQAAEARAEKAERKRGILAELAAKFAEYGACEICPASGVTCTEGDCAADLERYAAQKADRRSLVSNKDVCHSQNAKSERQKLEAERNWLAGELVDRTKGVHDRYVGGLCKVGTGKHHYAVFASRGDAIASVLKWAAQEVAKGES